MGQGLETTRINDPVCVCQAGDERVPGETEQAAHFGWDE
jgi:hypothetical protein